MFANHDACMNGLGPDGLWKDSSTALCPVPTEMMGLLELSSPEAYLKVYCLNPPQNSSQSRHRHPSYFTTVVSALNARHILPRSSKSTAKFNSAHSFSPAAKSLNVYSLIFAALARNLTKPDTVITMGLVASPLSVYLVLYVFRSLCGGHNHLASVFGDGMWRNRCAVLALVPLWIVVAVISAFPKPRPTVLLPFIVVFLEFPALTAATIVLLALAWATAMYLQQSEISKTRNPIFHIW
ncbi:hypothetical protein B0H17DRAFT_1126348 [Mycena rosella]|uniref:Uncharacterized protein n=1 Tax=Mycena rosella TaxID=1033263 RepID=A0AAD7M8G1_MYCRO|nr:hypothetical protein B0H17DRAFT_1126348 [Mycena rosella]